MPYVECDSGSDVFITHPNLLPIQSAVISSGKASLYKVKYVYYYEELIDLYDLIIVDNYNNYIMQRRQERRSEKQ